MLQKVYIAILIQNESNPDDCIGDIRAFDTEEKAFNFCLKENKELSEEYSMWSWASYDLE